MSRIGKAFTAHPATVGESYLEHMHSALGFSGSMVRAAVCCSVHAFLPFLFQKTGSRAIEDLHRRMVLQRSTRAATAPLPASASSDRGGHAAA